MQLKRQQVKEQVVIGATGLLWVTGLLLAGSDNPLMPWPNIAGVVIFLISSFFMARTCGPEEKVSESPTGVNSTICKNILFPQESEDGIQSLNAAVSPPPQAAESISLRRDKKWKHPREILPSTS